MPSIWPKTRMRTRESTLDLTWRRIGIARIHHRMKCSRGTIKGGQSDPNLPSSATHCGSSLSTKVRGLLLRESQVMHTSRTGTARSRPRAQHHDNFIVACPMEHDLALTYYGSCIIDWNVTTASQRSVKKTCCSMAFRYTPR